MRSENQKSEQLDLFKKKWLGSATIKVGQMGKNYVTTFGHCFLVDEQNTTAQVHGTDLNFAKYIFRGENFALREFGLPCSNVSLSIIDPSLIECFSDSETIGFDVALDIEKIKEDLAHELTINVISNPIDPMVYYSEVRGSDGNIIYKNVTSSNNSNQIILCQN